MDKSNASGKTVDQLFFSIEARHDLWRELNAVCKKWCNAEDENEKQEYHQKAKEILSRILPAESYQAFPGHSQLEAISEYIHNGDCTNAQHLARKLSTALLDGSYRSDASIWEISDEVHSSTFDSKPLPENKIPNKPYFEVLIANPGPSHSWHKFMNELKAHRRNLDEFIYEPVTVGTFEDTILAVILNLNLQTVIIEEGIPFSTKHNAPLLKSYLAEILPENIHKASDMDQAILIARLIKKIRPELDLFLITDRKVEKIAGEEELSYFNRVYYEVEEGMEIHLSILQGVAKRYETPYFDNLKNYADRPIGTFHALPIARGKSIFKSNWIRDMGEFYGKNLFLAESSATTGGLDSLLEPTGNIKRAQELAANAFGAKHAYFVTNGTSTSNKIVEQALLSPGDIIIVDRNCHKSHHYGTVLAGAYPLYLEAYPMMKYSMYGGVPLYSIKEALLNLRKENKLDRAKMIVLTNCTFDGHVYNTFRVMEECLAIKPDLVFLWDEAWFGFARYSPFLRQRTAMGGAEQIKATLNNPAYRKAFEEQRKKLGKDLSATDKTLLNEHLLMDPDKTKIRIYQTNSTHKSMSALRQGSMILVNDEDFHQVEEAFHEAIFTHSSTSPNLQIIASLDIARRQMELEGYEMVMRAMQLSFDIRREVNAHPLISKYFHVLRIDEMIPEEYRKSGIKSYIDEGTEWTHALHAFRDDEFALDPTRLTLVCGYAGFDGTQFKGLLADKYDIQLNKTSRNSVLFQTNINNSRSDVALLIKVLVEISKEIEQKLMDGGETVQQKFKQRVKSLMEDVPDLPNFSHFHVSFVEKAKSKTLEGDMRSAFYKAYKAENCEHIALNSHELDKRLKNGPPLISANFVIPYPPGFPIMVPGQIITSEIVTFMRKLDVKEIHGYDHTLGLKLIKPETNRGGK